MRDDFGVAVAACLFTVGSCRQSVDALAIVTRLAFALSWSRPRLTFRPVAPAFVSMGSLSILRVTPLAVFLGAAGLVPMPSAAAEGAGARGVSTRLEVRGVAGKHVGFTAMSSVETGVDFTNVLRGDLSLTNAVAHNGSGVAIGDVDGDGRPDLYFCSLGGTNQLYRNLGHWRFEPMAIGVAACAGQRSTGAAFADVDGDGDLDLLVNGIGTGTRLFLNDGHGTWTESMDSGLSRTASATSMALADIDGDGDLDLYCAHYIDVMHLADPTTRFAMGERDGRWVVTKVNGESTTLPHWKDRFEALPGGRVRELPEVHGLYRNDGHGHFTAIQFEPGTYQDAEGRPMAPPRDWGLSVMFRDLNGDGAPDLYVANDNASPDRIWINTGRGTFRALDSWKIRHTSRSSMAIDFADIDRDGRDDFVVVDMLAGSHGKRMTQLMREYPDPMAAESAVEVPRYNRNTLFRGRPDGSYAETAFFAGLAATDWSWGTVFLDVDLDGFEDLLVCNGFSFDVMDQDSHDQLRGRRLTVDQQKRIRQFHPPWPTENLAFRNRRDGTFEAAGREWGFDKAGISYGMALADLDGDGDLDVVINNLNEAPSLYRNDATAGRVAVRLRGLPPNVQGIGARIQLSGGAVTQSQEMICGGRYLSCDQALRVFAADASSDRPLQVEVRWRDGQRTTTPVSPNQLVEIVQPPPGPEVAARPEAPLEPPYFSDVSALLGHEHREDAFDDWSVQPLLPRRLSRLGPGVCWSDVNGDGWEDLVITAARGGTLALFLNEQGKGFRRVNAGTPSPGDQGAAVVFAAAPGQRRLWVASSDPGSRGGPEAVIASWSLENLAAGATLAPPTSLPAGRAMLGPLAVADVDGDGDLDVFLGGRHLPGRYPEPVDSALWINEGGDWRAASTNAAPFKSLGLVSGATFCDLDGDGAPDLVAALEWGPLRVFRNNHGHFEDMTEAWGFGSRTGWWTSVAAGDFDGDGRLDLVAGNWGRNSAYELYRPGPLRIVYGDWAGEETLAAVEAWREGDRWLPIRSRTWLARGIPDLAVRFPTHQAFANASVRDLWGDRHDSARTLEVNCLDAGVFLNRGSHFDFVPFPQAAQWAPIFGVVTGDYDGDGIEDVFLGQNFFGQGGDMSRDDAGRGLWLKGRGDGSFTAAETGIRIEGEQRAAAAADFDHDGRLDLVVTQNNGATRLYRNQRGVPGLRVSLIGPPGNPDAVGARMRVVYAGGRRGPCRSIQAGSGYWAQEGATQVLGLAEAPEALWIAWPGGRERTVSLKGSRDAVRVSFDDDLRQQPAKDR